MKFHKQGGVMTLEQYFSDKHRGAKADLARDLGITRTWLSLLVSGREVPSATLSIEIERRTGINRKYLRPDLFGEAL
jgi:DNA-binding transcriptional regulator YdaS (Cro superfamily)